MVPGFAGTRVEKGRLTQEEALTLAFPKCAVVRATVFLTPAQKKAVQKLTKHPYTSNLVYTYIAKRDGKLVGTAYFDAHKVRTHKQVLMVVVSPDCKVLRLELLAFGEPKEFIPSKKWYKQIIGRKLDKHLSIKGKIRNMTGATLTARATTRCARRILALHAVLSRPAPKPKPKPAKPAPKKPAKKSGDRPKVKQPG